MLYELLQPFYEAENGDFAQVPLCIIYPRRFCKTSLLSFMDAVFNPLPRVERFESSAVKAKVASLKKGKGLLTMGLHPVVSLDLTAVNSVDDLNTKIETGLENAGLDKSYLSLQCRKTPPRF